MATGTNPPPGGRDSQRAFAHRISHTLGGDMQSLQVALEALRFEAESVGAMDALGAPLTDLRRVFNRLKRRALDVAFLTLADCGELTPNLQLRPLKWVATAAARAAGDEATALGLKLRCDTTACGAARARIDRALMQRALSALLDNAMRFSPARGVVTLSVERDEQFGRFIVRDQGDGFPPGAVTRLFAPYEADANETSSRDDGFGLGLFIAQTIATAHGGRVYVIPDSAPGAVVAIELPLA